VVFKISVFTDIGSIVPRPWIHYVPINFDLSDFKEKLEWAKQNDDEIKKIAERGKEISQKVHSYKAYLCYTKTLLLKYHELRVKGRTEAGNIQKESENHKNNRK
jgi:transcriptional regulator of NAD metabolism